MKGGGQSAKTKLRKFGLPAGLAPSAEAAASAAFAAVTTATLTAAAASATAASCARAGFIDVQCASAQRHTVELLDRGVAFFVVRHFAKAESTGTTRLAVRDQANPVYGSKLLEKLTDFFFRRFIAKISNKNVLHVQQTPIGG
jgi:hypothetical protein